MTSMFRKFSQLSKKRVCVVLFTICLISPFFAVSASAESFEATAYFRGMNYYRLDENSSVIDHYDYPTFNVSIPRQGDSEQFVSYLSNSRWEHFRQISFSCAEFSVVSPDDNGFFGEVGFYLSYYGVLLPNGDMPSGEWEDLASGYSVTILNGNNEVITEKWLDPEFFIVSDSHLANGTYSSGVHYSFTVEVPEYTPILKISFGEPGYAHVRWSSTDPDDGFYGDIAYVIPSASLITERTSEELKALENITNIIINQNNISSQYYGDIISKVDSLYTEVGNLTDLQQQAIQQFDDWNIVTSVPGSVQNKVDKADQVVSDINSLVKPDPEQIVPDYLPDPEELHDISDILSPFFQNALIVQLCTMVLGFAFVSYVLFGKKG